MSTTNAHPSGLSEAALRELKAERDRLRAERKRIDGLLSKIEGLLGTGPTIIETPNLGMGLREGIIKILTSNPDGMRPVEVAQAMKAQGWNSEGKTPFAILVANQLWRMAREENSSIRRSEKTGKYKLMHGIDNKAAS